MKNVKVDQETCIGCGSCSAICPKVFAQPADKAQVVGEPEGEEVNVKMAKDACPTGSISYEE